MSEAPETPQNAAHVESDTPTIFCVGMAGSGKTTFMQRLNSHLHSTAKDGKKPYVMNLDPAVLKVPFHTNIDIRDSVKYKKVMENYNLGPNGAIMTSLNLFSTKIDQVLGLIEKRDADGSISNILVDTPGQIECFIWSASGTIITDSLATTFPTVLAYIVDTPRATSPATFMSNMLYACSILYKTKLPMIIVFNKCDVADATTLKEWMRDFEKFQEVLRNDPELSGEGENSSGYMGSLMNSLSLMLEEFYNHLDVVSVSSYTGEGFDDFMEAVGHKVKEYKEDYAEERKRVVAQREEDKKKQKAKDLTRLMNDMGIEEPKGNNPRDEVGKPDRIDTLSDMDTDEEGEDEDMGMVDRDDDEPGAEAAGPGLDAADEAVHERYKAALAVAQQEAKDQKTLDRLEGYMKGQKK
ncbi:GPN-loop GTPase 1 [Yarrowia sp. C11]|nr:GPN-loop GTPase 1 [Yarrowia sp. C11]KAG5370508.1 GPN-loop GTPase 1 [Yarrowia sp. E02]